MRTGLGQECTKLALNCLEVNAILCMFSLYPNLQNFIKQMNYSAINKSSRLHNGKIKKPRQLALAGLVLPVESA
jgi:hypothetical protein